MGQRQTGTELRRVETTGRTNGEAKQMEEGTESLRAMMREADSIVFFGGAGVSTESGIPDFRGAHGLYAGAQGRSYEEMLSHDYFMTHMQAFWDFYRHVMLYPDAQPNAAHRALARLEAQGRLKAVITQNIDGLHQAAGSRNVIELHGTVHRNLCMRCGRETPLAGVLEGEGIPVCEACGGPLKPDVVLYGEPLDEDTVERAARAIERCDLLVVGGTSLSVYPAAGFIRYRRHGTPLVLINHDATPYDREADLILRDNIARVLDEAVAQ